MGTARSSAHCSVHCRLILSFGYLFIGLSALCWNEKKSVCIVWFAEECDAAMRSGDAEVNSGHCCEKAFALMACKNSEQQNRQLRFIVYSFIRGTSRCAYGGSDAIAARG